MANRSTRTTTILKGEIMNELFDVGYMEIRDLKKLVKAVQKLGATVFDVRFSPRSRDPRWNRGNLEKVFGDRYVHVKDLGNINYKGGSIEFVNLESGMAKIAERLGSSPVVLMCGCWKRKECHRIVIGMRFNEKYGIDCAPLTLAMCDELANRDQPKQMDLFAG
jgi:hypothetical protein